MNNIMQLYHGSENIVKKPEFGKGNFKNDYGRGFYCTQNIELAKEWACGNKKDGFVNEYILHDKGLNIIRLNSPQYNILNWLAVLTHHRSYWQKSSIAEREKNIYRIIFTLIYLMQILLLAIVQMILITVLYGLLSITV